MKFLKHFLLILCLQAAFPSCRKTGQGVTAVASVNIVNAISDSYPIIPVLGTYDSIEYFSTALSIPALSSALYSPPGGAVPIYVVQGADTTEINSKFELFNGALNIKAGSIYSFFLAGDTLSPDTLFVQDLVPNYSDSSAGVRLVNLLFGSPQLSVDIQGSSGPAEFSGLAYKQLSPFAKFAANSAVGGSYIFEVRDQASDSLLTTYQWNYTLYKNNTIVVAGSHNAGNIQVFMYNDF
jgi:hypothetical protein